MGHSTLLPRPAVNSSNLLPCLLLSLPHRKRMTKQARQCSRTRRSIPGKMLQLGSCPALCKGLGHKRLTLYHQGPSLLEKIHRPLLEQSAWGGGGGQCELCCQEKRSLTIFFTCSSLVSPGGFAHRKEDGSPRGGAGW